MSADTQEAFDKSQHLHLIKILSKLEIGRTYPNLIKGMYKKPTANIILSAERLKRKDLLKIKSKTRMLLVSEIRQEKESEAIQIGKR